MLKLINANQTKLADAYTIENELITSTDLMERASINFCKAFIDRFKNKKFRISVFCGKGNNGGDGLAIARLLYQELYEKITVYIVDFSLTATEDYIKNLVLYQELSLPIFYIKSAQELENIQTDIVIDAVFGIGLNRGLKDEYALLVEKINQIKALKISVDIPSGMPSEGIFYNDSIIKSDLVITFQRPKLNFLLPMSAPYIKEWKVVNIGLDEDFIQNLESNYYWFWKKDIQNFIKPRAAFSHKGTFGYSLILAGEEQTMGAALLCAEACIRTGSGITKVLIPSSGLTALNIRVPEAMYVAEDNIKQLDWEKIKALCIGPGLGISNYSKNLLIQVLTNYKQPILFDADALNLLAENKNLLESVPENSVFTPHIKEFDRLFGTHNHCWDRIETAFVMAKKLKVFIVLKNRYTMIFTPEGLCYFNSSGSPAMSIGGMGDVLSGIITSFIAQGYGIKKSVLLGVFTHGYAGEQMGQQMFVVPPTDLLKQIPYIIKELQIK